MIRREAALRRGLPASAGVAVPADKRFHRSDPRVGRRRRALRTAGRYAVRAVLVATALGVVVWGVRRVTSSSAFTINRVVVHGNTHLSGGEVEALLEGIRNENIWRVDLNAYRQRVFQSPWVADVTLSRLMPSTVEVRVVERVPMAVARLGDQLFLVDRAGVVIDAYSGRYGHFDLPIVDGLSAPDGVDQTMRGRRIGLARRLLDSLRGRSDLMGRVSEVDVTNDRDAVVLLGADVTALHLGDTRFVERLDTYLALVPTLKERFASLDYVDLRFDERVYVRPRGQLLALAK